MKKTNLWIALALGLGLGVTLAAKGSAPTLLFLDAPGTDDRFAYEHLIGRDAPEFTLLSATGDTISFANMRERQLLIFLQIGSQMSDQIFAELPRIRSSFPVTLVGIGDASKLAATSPAPLGQIGYDREEEIVGLYEIYKMPSILLVDAGGKSSTEPAI